MLPAKRSKDGAAQDTCEVLLSQSSHPLSTQHVSNIENICQLEALMRVHVMMSLLHGKGSSGHKQLSIAALGFCFQMWKV